MSKTTNNPLSVLVGKTISNISLRALPLAGEAYTITCSDGEQYMLSPFSNPGQEFGSIKLIPMNQLLSAMRSQVVRPVVVNEEEEDEEDQSDECCQRCSLLFFPEDVIVLNDIGPVCKDCCTPADIAQAIKEETLDPADFEGTTPEEFLEEWRNDGPV